jgi:preprotein translocase subunit SecG
MATILLVIQVLLAVALIALILIQQGRGADTGATFGSGSSATVFGARGSASFLTRTTAILAILFFSNSFLLAYLSTRTEAPASLMERVAAPPAVPVPAPSMVGEQTPQSSTASDLPAVAGGESAPGPDPSAAVPVEVPADVPAVESPQAP